MSYEQEFSTVRLLMESSAVTRGVDAFALSLIKAERQIRKLFSHLVYQYPCFSTSDIENLRNTLANNNRVYFEGMIDGFNAIYPVTIEKIVGNQYQQLKSKIAEAIKHRNKIFHGQLTDKNLTRNELFEFVDQISTWCRLIAEAANKEIGYDGFARNSFQKSTKNKLHTKFKVPIRSVKEYEDFIKNNMQRP